MNLKSAFKECGAETVVVMTRYYSKIKAIQAQTKIRNVIATNIKEYLPPALRILFTLLKEKKEGDRIHLQPGDTVAGRPAAQACRHVPPAGDRQP